MNRPKIVTVCGAALLLAAAVVVVTALRNRQQSAPPPDVPVAALPAEVRVKAVEQKAEPVKRGERNPRKARRASGYYGMATCRDRMTATAASMRADTSLRKAVAAVEPARRMRKKSAARMTG